MSNYKAHTAFNLVVALPTLILAASYLLHPHDTLLLLFGGSFTYATLFMSPDMDLANKIKLFSLKGFLTFPFRSYSWAFSHRGISHSVLFGTLTRVIWLMGFITLAFYVVYQVKLDGGSFARFILTHKPEVSYVFAGVFLADLCHLLLDGRA